MNDWAKQIDHNKPVAPIGLCIILPLLVGIVFWAFIGWMIWRVI